jgi:hypothetical protein
MSLTVLKSAYFLLGFAFFQRIFRHYLDSHNLMIFKVFNFKTFSESPLSQEATLGELTYDCDAVPCNFLLDDACFC